MLTLDLRLGLKFRIFSVTLFTFPIHDFSLPLPIVAGIVGSILAPGISGHPLFTYNDHGVYVQLTFTENAPVAAANALSTVMPIGVDLHPALQGRATVNTTDVVVAPPANLPANPLPPAYDDPISPYLPDVPSGNIS